MSDYIKREDVQKAIDDEEAVIASLDLPSRERRIIEAEWAHIEQILKETPSADVIENQRISPITTKTKGHLEYAPIVRCKDCIHNGSIDTDCPFGWKDKKFNLPDPNDYCSYGEREEQK